MGMAWVHVTREAADMTLLGVVDWYKHMCVCTCELFFAFLSIIGAVLFQHDI